MHFFTIPTPHKAPISSRHLGRTPVLLFFGLPDTNNPPKQPTATPSRASQPLIDLGAPLRCATPTKPGHAKKQVDSGPACPTRQVLVPPDRQPQACDSANRVPRRKGQALRPAQSPTDGKSSTHFPNITPSQCPHRPSVQGGNPNQISAPGRIRTCGTWFRKPLLYPLSYGGTDRW